MKARIILSAAISVLIVVAACTPRGGGVSTRVAGKLSATVGAAVEASRTAEKGQPATVEATATAAPSAAVTQTVPATPSIAATSSVPTATSAAVTGTTPATATALPPTAAASEATSPAKPTDASATATAQPPQNYEDMSEEELAALVDQEVNEAMAGTDEASAAIEAAAADGMLTPEEVQELEQLIADTEELLALADEAINAYISLYDELAAASLEVLEETLKLVEETTAIVEGLDQTLQQVGEALAQKAEVSEEMIAKLKSSAEEAQGVAKQVQTKVADWTKTLPSELDQRVAAALAVVQNGEAPADRLGAITSAYKYLDTVRAALSDKKVTQKELAGIAQAGANASAGLKAFGGPKIQGLAGSFSEITSKVARGQLPQVEGSLRSLEGSLPARPGR